MPARIGGSTRTTHPAIATGREPRRRLHGRHALPGHAGRTRAGLRFQDRQAALGHPIADPKKGETAPAAPIAWNGLVFIGNAGGDMKGVKGRMYALDAKTGKIVWEFYLVPKAEGDVDARTARRRRRSTVDLEERRPATDHRRRDLDVLHARSEPPACSTCPAAIRRPISRPARARAKISIPARSWCSTPRPAPTGAISRSFRRIGTIGTCRAAPAVIPTAAGKKVLSVAPKDGHLYGFDLADNAAAVSYAGHQHRKRRHAVRARQGRAFLPGIDGRRGVERPGL